MPLSRFAGATIAGGVTVAALALGYFMYSKFGGSDDTVNTVAAPLSTGGGTRRHKKRSKSNRKRPSS